MLVAFTSLGVYRNKYDTIGIAPRMFMGFGYNPHLSLSGERLDILSFFSWMKKLQKEFSVYFTVYDASGYYIVNRIPQKNIRSLGEKPSSTQILDAIVNEQDRPKRREIINNCNLRSKYLRKAMDISGIGEGYIDSRKVFREDKNYAQSLAEALKFVSWLQQDEPDVIARIIPPNSNPASRLYLPLEIAEALYLKEVFNIEGKFGPNSEEFFDEAILKLTEEKKVPYQAVRCPIGNRRPGYLSDENVIWTSTSPGNVASILGPDEEYREFVSQYLDLFRKQGEGLESCVIRIMNKLKLEV